MQENDRVEGSCAIVCESGVQREGVSSNKRRRTRGEHGLVKTRLVWIGDFEAVGKPAKETCLIRARGNGSTAAECRKDL